MRRFIHSWLWMQNEKIWENIHKNAKKMILYYSRYLIQSLYFFFRRSYAVIGMVMVAIEIPNIFGFNSEKWSIDWIKMRENFFFFRQTKKKGKYSKFILCRWCWTRRKKNWCFVLCLQNIQWSSTNDKCMRKMCVVYVLRLMDAKYEKNTNDIHVIFVFLWWSVSELNSKTLDEK